MGKNFLNQHPVWGRGSWHSGTGVPGQQIGLRHKAFFLAWLLACCIFTTSKGHAHDLEYAIASADLHPDGSFQIAVAFHLAAFVLECQPADLPIAEWERLRFLSEDELELLVRSAEERFQRSLLLAFDGKEREPETRFPSASQVRSEGLALQPLRAPPVLIKGSVPAGSRTLSLKLPREIGPVLFKVTTNQGIVNQFLDAGQQSLTVDIQHQSAVNRDWPRRLVRFFSLGFQHILPGGLDHILFVLGLFLLSPAVKALLWQVTFFTIAHSVTLALSVYGWFRLSPEIVEPLIALSIAVVAVENLLTVRLHSWRLVVVFSFGLLHGLGFASVLRDMKLPLLELAPALAAFNAGVEGGQLAVLGLAFLSIGWFRSRSWYRTRVCIPASALIALIGIYWTCERVLIYQ